MQEKLSLEEIRENEKISHTQVYAQDELYAEGSWLRKPIKTVSDLFPYFATYRQLNVLDLGCGVGRNCISIASRFQEISCTVDCVDILDIAIEKLAENAGHYGVSQNIHGFVQPIEDYQILRNHYDWILAVSALEHVDSRESFISKLEEIKRGLRKNGIVCLVLNSNIQEVERATGKPFPAQFEINLPTVELQAMLNKIFDGWEVIKSTVKEQHYEIPRETGIFDLHTHVVTFVARK